MPYQPVVRVSGALRTIMMEGDLSAHIQLDTLDKHHLYALGPVAGLKGELMVLDGQVYSSTRNGNDLLNQQNKISSAAMLVYTLVEKWKAITFKANIMGYEALEKLIETTAKTHGYDLDKPLVFKLQGLPQKAGYHVIHWKAGARHTMENHRQYAYEGQILHSPVTLLGFYSIHHQTVFTHHTTFMHVHMLEDKNKITGHLDQIELKGPITIYLPEK